MKWFLLIAGTWDMANGPWTPGRAGAIASIESYVAPGGFVELWVAATFASSEHGLLRGHITPYPFYFRNAESSFALTIKDMENPTWNKGDAVDQGGSISISATTIEFRAQAGTDGSRSWPETSGPSGTNPIPEPGTITLMGIGPVGLLYRKLCKKQI